MTTLDKLRDKWAEDIATLGRAGHQNGPAVRQIEKMLRDLDAFEAAHPGLVDKTVPCPRCDKPTVLDGRYKDRRLGYWREVCPACVEASP